MEYAVVATPAESVGLRLDWERFSYAGKFVVTNTGKTVAAIDGTLDDPTWPPDPREAEAPGVLAAVSFNTDRVDADTAWLRYVTVRHGRRGAGIGPRLCAFTAEWLLTDHDRVRIAVNNPYAYDALHKAGFGWTGDQTGLRERVLERPAPPDADYAAGLRSYLDVDANETERSFVESRCARGPPTPVDAPKGEDYTGGARTQR